MDEQPTIKVEPKEKKSKWMWYFIFALIVIILPILVNLIFSTIECTEGNCKNIVEGTLGTIFNNDNNIYDTSKKILENSFLIQNQLQPKYDFKEIAMMRTYIVQCFIWLILIFGLVFWLFKLLFSKLTESNGLAIVYALITTIVLLGLIELFYVMFMTHWTTGNWQWIIPFKGLGILIETIFNKTLGWFPNMYNYVNLTITNTTTIL